MRALVASLFILTAFTAPITSASEGVTTVTTTDGYWHWAATREDVAGTAGPLSGPASEFHEDLGSYPFGHRIHVLVEEERAIGWTLVGGRVVNQELDPVYVVDCPPKGPATVSDAASGTILSTGTCTWGYSQSSSGWVVQVAYETVHSVDVTPTGFPATVDLTVDGQGFFYDR